MLHHAKRKVFSFVFFIAYRMFLGTTKGNKGRCHQDQEEEKGNINSLQWCGPMWVTSFCIVCFDEAIIIIATLEMQKL